MDSNDNLQAIFGLQLAPEDVKWLALVRESELRGSKLRPLPVSIQTRLRILGLIDLRRRTFVLTAAGLKALKEALNT